MLNYNPTLLKNCFGKTGVFLLIWLTVDVFAHLKCFGAFLDWRRGQFRVILRSYIMKRIELCTINYPGGA